LLANAEPFCVKPYELTNVYWKLLRPVFDLKGRLGPKRCWSRRLMVAAILWLAWTGL
jgi:hypothetical protein